ncbi:hypothetical protein HC891_07330 [Candidatus Gracilibacteria bacterium]|nr:hypothetical protein [Candidatus Gracilibacteria bacterium]
MVTAVISGLQGQTFEAAFSSSAAERLFAGVAGASALVAIAITVGIVQAGRTATTRAPASAGTARSRAGNNRGTATAATCIRRWIGAGHSPRVANVNGFLWPEDVRVPLQVRLTAFDPATSGQRPISDWSFASVIVTDRPSGCTGL